MKKIFIALLVLTACSDKTRDFPSGCETQIVAKKYNKENNMNEELILVHCKDTVYYLLEDKLLYKFPVKK